MATQKEIADQLNTVQADLKTTKEQLVKIGGETTTLLDKVTAQQTKIDELLALIAAGGNVSAELQAAVDGVKTASDEVKAQAATVDALVPDA